MESSKPTYQKKIVPLFEEFTRRTLLIVDVQEPFAKWWEKNDKPDFVDDLVEYCNEFDQVYQIWDSIDASKPSYEFPNQVQSVEKQYGGEVDRVDAIRYFDRDTAKKVEGAMSGETRSEDIFYTESGDALVHVNGSHEWMWLSEEMIELFNRLRSTGGQITLVGGAEGECLYDIEVCLSHFDVDYVVNHKFTYHA